MVRDRGFKVRSESKERAAGGSARRPLLAFIFAFRQLLPSQNKCLSALTDETGTSQPIRIAKLEHIVFASSVAEGSSLRIVTISGQVGVDQHQLLAGDGGFKAQVDRAFSNLVLALSAARCTISDVAKLTIYVVGYEQSKANAIREAIRKHFGDQALPACTLVGVQALARPEFQVEVEALAITTPGRGP